MSGDKSKSPLPSNAEWQKMNMFERCSAQVATCCYEAIITTARIAGRRDIADNLVKNLDNEYITRSYNELNQKLEKLQKEWEPYQKMEGWGERFMHNVYPVFESVCKDVGVDNVISYDDFVKQGKNFDKNVKEIKHAIKNKTKEEIEQFNNMGGVGEYLAQNATTVLAKASQSVGMETLAQNIENGREDSKKLGKAFDDKLKEEWAQFNSMDGVGEYMVQNMVSALSKTAKALGEEQLAQDIEAKREDFLAYSKSFDNKLKEEWAQFNSMGGVGEYIAQNTTTLIAKTAKKLGYDELAKKVEAKREDFLAQGKALDEKAKEYLQPFQPQIKELNDYLAENATDKVKENTYANVEQKNPVQKAKVKLNDSSSSNSDDSLAYTYQSAEIKRLENFDGSITESVMIDGKKHGAEITYFGDKIIQSVKLYDHGKEVDLKKHKIEVKQENIEGFNCQYLLLDGQKFGMETVSDEKHQNLAVTFYDKGNIMYRGAEAKVTYGYEDVPTRLNSIWDIHETLSQQKGEVKDNPVATSQGIRIDKQARKKKQETSKKVTTKAKSQSNQQIALTGLKKNNEMSN